LLKGTVVLVSAQEKLHVVCRLLQTGARECGHMRKGRVAPAAGNRLLEEIDELGQVLLIHGGKACLFSSTERVHSQGTITCVVTIMRIARRETGDGVPPCGERTT